MITIQSILNKISDLASRTGLFSIQKNEFFGLLTDMANKVKEVNDNVNLLPKALIWQNPVANFAALATTYPNPLQGWAAMVTGEGFIYGWNGSAWKNTGLTAFPTDVIKQDQTLPQIIGSTLKRALKIFSTDAEFSNMPTVGGVSLLNTFSTASQLRCNKLLSIGSQIQTLISPTLYSTTSVGLMGITGVISTNQTGYLTTGFITSDTTDILFIKTVFPKVAISTFCNLCYFDLAGNFIAAYNLVGEVTISVSNLEQVKISVATAISINTSKSGKTNSEVITPLSNVVTDISTLKTDSTTLKTFNTNKSFIDKSFIVCQGKISNVKVLLDEATLLPNTIMSSLGIISAFTGYKTSGYLTNSSVDGFAYYEASFQGVLRPELYANVSYYDSTNLFICSYLLNGNQLIAVPKNYSIKICVQSATSIYSVSSVSETKANLLNKIDFTTPQTLTIAQQAIVRNSIGAESTGIELIVNSMTDKLSTYVLATETKNTGRYGSGGTLTADGAYKNIIIDRTLHLAAIKVNLSMVSQYQVGACYFDSAGILISYEGIGTSDMIPVVWVNHVLTIPSNTSIIKITGYIASSTLFEVYCKDINSSIDITLPQTLTDDKKQNARSNLTVFKNTLATKKVVFFGTSIPAGGGNNVTFEGVTILNQYPLMVAQLLGVTVINESVGSSLVRNINPYTGNYKGMPYDACLKSLSQTVAEKQSILDHWTTGLDANGNILGGGTFGWKDLLVGGAPNDYTTFATQATILGWSYENKIVSKYLNTVSPNFVYSPDIFVFEHAHNDLAGNGNMSNGASGYYYDESDAVAIAIPDVRNDRSRYCGAMNYLFDVILSYNPRATIVLLGHYENQMPVKGYRITNGQMTLANYWEFPLIKTWEKTGWSQQKITTTGYWGTDGIWVALGGVSQQLAMTNLWMKDNLHPHSDVSGSANAHLAYIIANQLKSFM